MMVLKASCEMIDKNDPVLSLRIALDTPSEGAAMAAADRLNKGGLKVEHISPRGLLVSGPKSQLEDFFDTRIDFSDKVPQFFGEPHFDRLPRTVTYRAYFPSEPIYF